jgi:hypothetical protein
MQNEQTIEMPKVGDRFRSTETGRGKTISAYCLLLEVVGVTETGIELRRMNVSTKAGRLDMSASGRRVETPETFAAKMQTGILETLDF